MKKVFEKLWTGILIIFVYIFMYLTLLLAWWEDTKAKLLLKRKR